MRLSDASYCMRSPSRFLACTTTWLGRFTRTLTPGKERQPSEPSISGPSAVTTRGLIST